MKWQPEEHRMEVVRASWFFLAVGTALGVALTLAITSCSAEAQGILSRPVKVWPAVKPAQTEPDNPSKPGPLSEAIAPATLPNVYTPKHIEPVVQKERQIIPKDIPEPVKDSIRIVFDTWPGAEIWYSDNRSWRPLGKITEWIVKDPGDAGDEWEWAYRFAAVRDGRWKMATGKWRGEKTLTVRIK